MHSARVQAVPSRAKSRRRVSANAESGRVGGGDNGGGGGASNSTRRARPRARARACASGMFARSFSPGHSHRPSRRHCARSPVLTVVRRVCARLQVRSFGGCAAAAGHARDHSAASDRRRRVPTRQTSALRHALGGGGGGNGGSGVCARAPATSRCQSAPLRGVRALTFARLLARWPVDYECARAARCASSFFVARCFFFCVVCHAIARSPRCASASERARARRRHSDDNDSGDDDGGGGCRRPCRGWLGRRVARRCRARARRPFCNGA